MRVLVPAFYANDAGWRLSVQAAEQRHCQIDRQAIPLPVDARQIGHALYCIGLRQNEMDCVEMLLLASQSTRSSYSTAASTIRRMCAPPS